MTAPELVIHLDIPGPRRERQLDIQLTRTQMQLDAVLDAVASEATWTWLGTLDTPPTDEQITEHHEQIRDHFVAIALAATAVKRGKA